jgi:PAS domain S-box-containing protein
VAGLIKRRKLTDSYETEIKVSLALLICFLLSLNFITAYSLGKARQAQNDCHVLNLELVKESIRSDIENNDLQMPEIVYLSDLAHRIHIDKIELVDNQDRPLLTVGGMDESDSDRAVTISAPIRDKNGDIVYQLFVSSVNREGLRLRRLALFDSIFRVAGLFAGLIVAFFFIKTVLNPYRKIKLEASELGIDQVDPGNTDDVEYVVRTFHEIIRELKEKESLLQSLYASSEKRANSLARYNEYILGGISSGVVICDNNGLITRFNPAAKKILNVDYDHGQGQHYRDVFGKKSDISRIFDNALDNGETFSRLEFEITIDETEKRWIGLSSSLISDDQEHRIGAAVLLTDLTRIKKLQEIADFTEKMAAVGEMAAGLAHEFRNSVAAIMGFGKLIKKMIPDKGKANELAEMIISESQATEEMLRRFLSFARPLDVMPQAISIHQIINDSLKAVRESGPSDEIEVIIEDSCECPQIQGDPTLLKNAFNNLFINACQAMEGRGALGIYMGVDKEHSQIIIKITDTGKGMSDDVIEKIFNPIFTTKDKGTGLGLALVKKIIAAHYGTIEVESEEGTGTTFIVTIPLYADIISQSDKAKLTSEIKTR